MSTMTDELGRFRAATFGVALMVAFLSGCQQGTSESTESTPGAKPTLSQPAQENVAEPPAQPSPSSTGLPGAAPKERTSRDPMQKQSRP
jgi:hypothetical protein